MTAPISHATGEALREAMARLLAGRPVKTDGRLTVVNLAIEAGVSRATANRAAGILADFRRAVAGLRARGPCSEGARAGAEEESNAHILAQHIQARALHAKLQEAAGRGRRHPAIQEKGPCSQRRRQERG